MTNSCNTSEELQPATQAVARLDKRTRTLRCLTHGGTIETTQLYNNCFPRTKDTAVSVGRRQIYKTLQGKRVEVIQFPQCKKKPFISVPKAAICNLKTASSPTRYNTHHSFLPQHNSDQSERQRTMLVGKHCREINNREQNNGNWKSNQTYFRKSVHFRPNNAESQNSRSLVTNVNHRREIYDYFKTIDRKKTLLQLENSAREEQNKETKNVEESLALTNFEGKRKTSKREREKQREYRLRKWVNISDDSRTDSLSELNVSDIVSTICGNESISTKEDKKEKTTKDRAVSNMAKVQAALSCIQASACTNLQNGDDTNSKSQEVTDSGVWCDTVQDKGPVDSSSKLSGIIINERKQNTLKCNGATPSPTKFQPTIGFTISSAFNKDNTIDKGKMIAKSPIVSCTWWQNDIKTTEDMSKTSSEAFLAHNSNHGTGSENNKIVLLSSTHTKDNDKRSKMHISHSEPQLKEFQERSGKKYKKLKSESPSRRDRLPEKKPLKATEPLRSYKTEVSAEFKSHENKQHSFKKDINNMHERKCRSFENKTKDVPKYHPIRRKKNRKFSYRHNGYLESFDSSSDEDEKQHCHHIRCESCHSASRSSTCYRNTPADKKRENLHPNPSVRSYYQSSSITCSCCSKQIGNGGIYVINDSLYVKQPLTAETEDLLKRPSDYIAVVDGNGQIVMYQCDCKQCVQLRKLNGTNCFPNASAERIYQPSPLLPRHFHEKNKTKPLQKKKRSRSYGHRRRSSSNLRSNYSTDSKMINIFSLCWKCLGDGSSSSDSGGSDTGGDDGGGDEDGDGFVEHGDGPDSNGDSDGGDSGSDSGGDEESFNSAELFDDQNNALDSKQMLGEADDSDGPASNGSDCSDSLTELRSRSKKGSGSSDDEGEEDTVTEEDDDDFLDSWDSVAILERE